MYSYTSSMIFWLWYRRVKKWRQNRSHQLLFSILFSIHTFSEISVDQVSLSYFPTQKILFMVNIYLGGMILDNQLSSCALVHWSTGRDFSLFAAAHREARRYCIIDCARQESSSLDKEAKTSIVYWRNCLMKQKRS